MNPNSCPVVTTDFEHIHHYLFGLPLDELIFLTEQIHGTLSSAEKINYDLNRYCTDYSDVQGRVNFIKALFDNGIIATVHIPLSYQRDPRLIELLRPKSYEYFVPIAQELKEEGAALTDELEETPTTITVSNPRWEHVDETRKQESPAVARIGDTVALMVDVTGYPEGAPVTFDIFDTSSEPAMRIETEKGKNEGGTARIEWVVADPDQRGEELKLEFEGSARSKSSGRAPIDLSNAVYRVELVDDDGNKLEGVKVVFTVAGEESEVLTDKEGVAKHPAKDPAVKADVQVEWDGKVEGTASATSGSTSTSNVDDEETFDETATVDTTPDADDTTADPVIPIDSGTGETKTPEETTDSFSVQLVDEQEKPLEGVEVQFKVGGGEPVSVVTDEQGNATLSGKDAEGAEEAEVSVVWKE